MTNAMQVKLIRGMADFGAVEAVALASELRQISAGVKAGHPPHALHTARLAAWGNLAKVKDSLVNLANEIDRIGDDEPKLLPCGCPEQFVKDCGHQEGCRDA